MRIFSYIFTALVAVFVINIVLSFALPSYRTALVNVRTSIFPDSKKAPVEIPTETKKSETDRLAESLDRIDKHIESLGEIKKTGAGVFVGSGSIVTLSGTRTSQEDVVPKEPEISVSGLFLAKIMPEVILKKVDNKGFFGIQVMGKIAYNTYSDEKKKVKIYAFSESYDTLLLNMKLASTVYKINETDQFF